MSTIENARPQHSLYRSIPSEDSIKRAILQQLPRGFERTGAWFPLLIDGDEFYIKGSEVVTLAEHELRNVGCSHMSIR